MIEVLKIALASSEKPEISDIFVLAATLHNAGKMDEAKLYYDKVAA